MFVPGSVLLPEIASPRKRTAASLWGGAAAAMGAEREGFDPPVQLPVRRISSAVRSSTPASFHRMTARWYGFFLNYASYFEKK